MIEFWGRIAVVGCVIGVCAALHAEDKPQAANPGTTDPPAASAPETKPAPTTAPAAEDQVRTQRQPSVDEVLRAFQEMERPILDPLLPVKGSEQNTSPRSSLPEGRRPRLSDGYYLDDRVGRLGHDESWNTLILESDNPEEELPLLKILPNRMLEMMIRESEGSSESPLFIVSGEITEFMNENYLLIRKSLRKRDLGNLKK